MTKNYVNWKVAGAAGEGIKSTGMIFSKACLRLGLHTFDYTEYPSLIRGGHNTYQVLASMDKVYAPEKPVDILIALNHQALEYHTAELQPQSVIVYDPEDNQADLSNLKLKGLVLPVPLNRLAKEAGGERLMANNVALGVSMFLLNFDLTTIKAVIGESFSGKKSVLVEVNQKAAQAGYDYAQSHFPPISEIALSFQTPIDNLTMSGNEALSLGAIAGGMQAYIAYPMTPSSTILHQLADWQAKANIFVKHAEDEIGVINMALGMSFAGVRVACGTSGGGFCYMTEAVGLSGIAELPLVIFEAQRPGPALGMPTWTAQADLLFAINAAQDEFPRIVLAPGDVTEAFNLAKLSFDLAENYQIPVIILSDKHLSESNESIHLETTTFSHEQVSFNQHPEVDASGFYPRYRDTASGISLRTIPGQANGLYMANSYEHDPYGLGSETPIDRITQMDKRFQKFDSIKTHLPDQFYDGSDHPQITFISWGSTKGAVRAGIKLLRSQGIDAAMLNLSWLWPFPIEPVKAAIDKSQNAIVIEGNKTSQLARLIKEQVGYDIYHKRTKYDGRPFFPDEIIQYSNEILNL